jgi:hypothetical protein
MIYHAIVIDETGCEFPAQVEADDFSEAMDLLREDYPEARGFENVATTAERREQEHDRYMRLMAEIDGDYDYADDC